MVHEHRAFPAQVEGLGGFATDFGMIHRRLLKCGRSRMMEVRKSVQALPDRRGGTPRIPPLDDVGAPADAFLAAFVPILEGASQQQRQLVGRRICPEVFGAEVRIFGDRGGIHPDELSGAEEPSIAFVKEVHLAAPSRGDAGLPGRHGFHVGKPPAFSARGKDEAVAGGVEGRHRGIGKEILQEMNGRHVLERKPLTRKPALHLYRHRLSGSEGIAAQHQADVVIGAKGLGPRREQDIPALAANPLEDGQEGVPATGPLQQCVWRCRQVRRRVDAIRNNMQLSGIDSGRGEGPQVEGGRHPYVVHLVAGGSPAVGKSFGLEHRPAGKGVSRGVYFAHLPPQPARALGVARHVAADEQAIARRSRQERLPDLQRNGITRQIVKKGRIVLERIEGDLDTGLRQSRHRLAILPSVTGVVEERPAPAQSRSRGLRSCRKEPDQFAHRRIEVLVERQQVQLFSRHASRF